VCVCVCVCVYIYIYIYSRGKSRRYPLNRRLGEPHSRSGRENFWPYRDSNSDPSIIQRQPLYRLRYLTPLYEIQNTLNVSNARSVCYGFHIGARGLAAPLFGYHCNYWCLKIDWVAVLFLLHRDYKFHLLQLGSNVNGDYESVVNCLYRPRKITKKEIHVKQPRQEAPCVCIHMKAVQIASGRARLSSGAASETSVGLPSHRHGKTQQINAALRYIVDRRGHRTHEISHFLSPYGVDDRGSTPSRGKTFSP
jgi:hypothetical protein